MSGKISSVVKQLIVLEKLLSRVVRFHALRTNEALKHSSATWDTSQTDQLTKRESKITHRPTRIDLSYLRCLIMVQVCAAGWVRLCVLRPPLPWSLGGEIWRTIQILLKAYCGSVLPKKYLWRVHLTGIICILVISHKISHKLFCHDLKINNQMSDDPCFIVHRRSAFKTVTKE